jgi:replicative DNA helicase
MNTIEKELLHRIITDRPFAEYITQRIDIGDFDDEVANRIYEGLMDLLCRGRPVSYEVLTTHFHEDRTITRTLEILNRHSNKG